MLICVEGCLGVGKTTFVQCFAEQFPYTPFYEEATINPFLLDFYRDPVRYAVHVQYTFLLLQERRFRAAVTCAKGQVGGEKKKKDVAFVQEDPPSPVICDFHPFKSLVFSSVVLQPEAQTVLTQLYQLLLIPQPDLVIYLRADENTILARLRKRNDIYRDAIDSAYITRVCNAYDSFFHAYSDLVVTVDTTHIDYRQNPREISIILRKILLQFSS